MKSLQCEEANSYILSMSTAPVISPLLMIINHTLEEKYVYKKDGTKRINKTGVPMVELNFPKSSEYNIFVRGTSSDSTHKPWILNGTAADGTKTIHSYTQQIWIKGSFLVNELNKIEYI